MKKLSTLFLSFILVLSVKAQTTVYTTGQTYTDAWTGWSVPVVTGITSSSVNGAYIYNFNGMSGNAFTVETYRQFTINSNDLDLYLSATTQNSTVSVEFSTDNVSYSQIGSLVFGAGFATSTLIIPTFDPGVSSFYLKLKMVGTFASPSQTNFNNLKIDAVVSTSGVSEFTLGNSVFYTNGILAINSGIQNYEVSVFDINGQLITSEQNMKSFDFSAYNQGVYFISFTHNGERKTLKVAHVK